MIRRSMDSPKKHAKKARNSNPEATLVPPSIVYSFSSTASSLDRTNFKNLTFSPTSTNKCEDLSEKKFSDSVKGEKGRAMARTCSSTTTSLLQPSTTMQKSPSLFEAFTPGAVTVNSKEFLSMAHNEKCFVAPLLCHGNSFPSPKMGLPKTVKEPQNELRWKTSKYFPVVMHRLLCAEHGASEGLAHWDTDNVSFRIDRINHKLPTLLAKYFNHSKYDSLRRQLNCYGFRTNRRGYWYHTDLRFHRFCSLSTLENIQRLVRSKSSKATENKEYTLKVRTPAAGMVEKPSEQRLEMKACSPSALRDTKRRRRRKQVKTTKSNLSTVETKDSIAEFVEISNEECPEPQTCSASDPTRGTFIESSVQQKPTTFNIEVPEAVTYSDPLCDTSSLDTTNTKSGSLESTLQVTPRASSDNAVWKRDTQSVMRSPNQLKMCMVATKAHDFILSPIALTPCLSKIKMLVGPASETDVDSEFPDFDISDLEYSILADLPLPAPSAFASFIDGRTPQTRSSPSTLLDSASFVAPRADGAMTPVPRMFLSPIPFSMVTLSTPQYTDPFIGTMQSLYETENAADYAKQSIFE